MDFRPIIEATISELRELSGRPECMGRLHEIERQMVADVLSENRHLKCEGCLRWMNRLIEKARGVQGVRR